MEGNVPAGTSQTESVEETKKYAKTFSVTKLTLDALNTHFSLYGNAEWVTDGNEKSLSQRAKLTIFFPRK